MRQTSFDEVLRTDRIADRDVDYAGNAAGSLLADR